MAKHLADLLVLTVQITGRAFARAVTQELEASRAAARARAGATHVGRATVATGLSLEEAMQILNVAKLEPELVEQNFQRLFTVNDKARGGTLYLQSKVYRAKERIDREIEESLNN